jgi:hypothetical protein
MCTRGRLRRARSVHGQPGGMTGRRCGRLSIAQTPPDVARRVTSFCRATGGFWQPRVLFRGDASRQRGGPRLAALETAHLGKFDGRRVRQRVVLFRLSRHQIDESAWQAGWDRAGVRAAGHDAPARFRSSAVASARLIWGRHEHARPVGPPIAVCQRGHARPSARLAHPTISAHGVVATHSRRNNVVVDSSRKTVCGRLAKLVMRRRAGLPDGVAPEAGSSDDVLLSSNRRTHSMSKLLAGWMALAFAAVVALSVLAGTAVPAQAGEGQRCLIARQCRGPLPDSCIKCSDGKSHCAHWACVHHKCAVRYCPR